MIPFDQINSHALSIFPELVRQWCPDGEPSGNEWVARNPTRNDKGRGSFKINTKTGVWSDFSTGENGKDPVSLYAYLFHADEQGKAAKELASQLGLSGSEPAPMREITKRPDPEQEAEQAEPLEVAPENVAPPAAFSKRVGTKFEKFPIVAKWAYRNAQGQLLGYACRYEFTREDGRLDKDVVCCRWIDGKWRWKSFPKPRPLYGLHTLTANPDLLVLVVEGEKTADAAQALYPDAAVVTWAGGSKAIQHVDWSPLSGRSVILLPDNDAAGFAAMEGWLDKRGQLKPGVYQHIVELAKMVVVVDPPAGSPEGWDLADHDGWDSARAYSFLSGQREPRPPMTNQAEPEQERYDYLDYSMPPEMHEYGADITFEVPDDRPFRFLGFMKNGNGMLTHHYMSNGSNQVLCMTAASHTKNNLLELAPLHYWERIAPGGRGGSVDWDMAINSMLQQSQRAGIYNPDMTRGRGAWWDDGRPTIHLGTRVIVAGEAYSVDRVPSRYIYEQALELPVSIDNPLASAEAYELVKICRQVTWEKPVNAMLLSGWIVTAIVCGALRWRPHVWITGGAGTGKSTVMNSIIKRCLGRMSLFVKGDTTKAGLQQNLQHDALAVIFDEAESEKKSAASRIDEIMQLVTVSSSEDEAMTLKGSAGGKSVSYKIRSCFAFSSITTNIKQHAARTRVSVLGMRRNTDPNAKQQFEALVDQIESTLTNEWVERLHARAIRLIPAIRHNTEVFSNAGAAVLGSKRLGDQIGSLLAGAYALHSNGQITQEQAEQWIANQDWAEVQSIEEQSDEHRCLAHVLEKVIRVTGTMANTERSVGELISRAAYLTSDTEVTEDDAQAALNRIGIRVPEREQVFWISNSHTGIAKLLDDTPWAGNWGKTFKRLPGAEAIHNPVRIGKGQPVQRVTAVPLSIIQ
jgi:putative DNA primase/helicase